MEYHKPVLYDEVIENLITNENGVYLDCTLGGAGHTIGILENTGEKSTVVAIDQDEDAIRFAKIKLENYQNRIKIFKDNFKNLDTVLYLAGYEKIDGILMDIGVSSKQLDNPERGFSYKYDAKLDMRMNKNDKLSAYEVVNDFTEKEISDILYKYGEEPRGRKIAKRIVEKRQEKKNRNNIRTCRFSNKSNRKEYEETPSKKNISSNKNVCE